MAYPARRFALPAVILVAAVAMAVSLSGASDNSFVTAPLDATQGTALRGSPAAAKQTRMPLDVLALGVGAGLMETQPAQAYGIFYDELVPYASVTVFTIIWGIVLGFVLLRLQEAFPE
eukprot:CAMPEP_0172717378 /NCGR_PEP_ID=MMETSP1074-20121228/71255_1 /TAXON_ID=2916 /ORGANISM="Ceratium fusus, Strain PA161109" /LENGTH=117 /DNA_ID=CAMNT_0013542305 /DNA_START=59 /DNA_END=412 /DNA_ORIENTATION=-